MTNVMGSYDLLLLVVGGYWAGMHGNGVDEEVDTEARPAMPVSCT